MSDTALNKIIQYGTRADRTAFTPNPASGSQVLYLWYETDHAPDVWAWDGSAWQQINAGSSGTVTHTAGALTLDQLAYGNGTADIKVTAATDGQIPIGKTSDGTAKLATVTAGAGIAITNGANSLTVGTSTAQRTKSITFAVDGGGSALTTSFKADVYIPYGCTITAVTLVADQSGSVQLDIQKCAFGSFPGSLTSIVASDPPVLSSAQTSQDTTLTGWTTSISAGDMLEFSVTSVSTITRLNCVLTVTVS